MAIQLEVVSNTQNEIFGMVINSWDNPAELMGYLSQLKNNTYGWIKIQWSADYTSSLAFKIDANGKPSACDAYFNHGDCVTIVKQLGQEVAEMLLGDRLI